MQNLSPSHESSLSEDKYSVLQGYNICLIFLGHLGLLIMPYTSSLDEKSSEEYAIFFGSLGLGFECYLEWNKAIYRIKNITKNNQKTMKMNLQDIFLCTIEFCRVYSEWWKAKLEYLVNLLESMRNEPQKHSTEWEIWKRVIDDVINNQLTIVDDFDWEFDFPE